MKHGFQIPLTHLWLSDGIWLQRSGLTHWGRVTHICVSELTIIGGLLLIEPLGTYVSEISIGIQTFSFKKMHLNMSSAKWRPFCLGLNVLTLTRVMACCLTAPSHYLNVESSPIGHGGISMRSIAHEVFKISICMGSLRMTFFNKRYELKLHKVFSLKYRLYWFPIEYNAVRWNVHRKAWNCVFWYLDSGHASAHHSNKMCGCLTILVSNFTDLWAQCRVPLHQACVPCPSRYL